jgi:hypothetical protein
MTKRLAVGLAECWSHCVGCCLLFDFSFSYLLQEFLALAAALELNTKVNGYWADCCGMFFCEDNLHLWSYARQWNML